jgi:glycosyltransferase involved in cell wall biosynthesis
MNKICAVIPAYNEEKSLGLLLKKIKAHPIDIIVVDDGSTDQTTLIAEQEGAYIIRHSANEGKGGALRDGLRFALEKGYDIIISLDGDGQHDPDEIPLFIEKINASEAGIIIGNRLHSPKGMPASRLFINKLFSGLTSKVCGQNIPDALCGYRIIKKEVLKNIILKSERFDIDPEILIKSAKAGFKLDSINIRCIYAEESSHIRPMQDGNRFFRLIIRESKDN